MPRAATIRKPATEPADPGGEAPDNGAAARQRVVHTAATGRVQVPPGAVSSVFTMAKKPAGAGKTTRLPLGPATVTIHRALPVPMRTGMPGVSKWDEHWAALGVGDCAELDERQANSFAAWAQKQRLPFLLRRLSASTKGLWRTA